MLRFFILVVMFTIVIVGVPQIPAAQSILSQTNQITSQTAFYINLAALCLAAPLAWFTVRRPNGWIYTAPGVGTLLLQRTVTGVLIAALFTLFEALSGYAATLGYLLLVPLAFFVAELTYQALLLIVARLRKQPDLQTSDAIAHQAAERASEGKVPRFLVTLPIYVFVVVYLPQQDDFRQFEASLTGVDTVVAIAICLVALILSLLIPFVYFRYLRTPPDMAAPNAQKEAYKARIKDTCLTSIAVGLGFAALINLVSYVLGAPPILSMLVLMPVGFLIAEIVYAGLEWRLRFPPI